MPFACESALSGIRETGFHTCVWYARDLNVPAAWKGRVLLHFGAVDYEARLWINGRSAAFHRGGQTPFTLDITDYLSDGAARLALRVRDSADVAQPRGKQSWTRQSEGCYYTRTTGIWQTVWLESVPAFRIGGVRYSADVERGILDVTANVLGARSDAVF